MIIKTHLNSLGSTSRIRKLVSTVYPTQSGSLSYQARHKSCKHASKSFQMRAVSSAPETGVGKSFSESSEALKEKQIIFVMGGPGSGKGTQCEMLSRDLDAAFFSAGDLIRDFLKTDSPKSRAIQEIILDGRVIPSSVTVGLLCDAMCQTSKRVVLVDGFPRNLENRREFRDAVGRDCDLALFFRCSEEEMRRRLLGRRVGRADDNERTIAKRVAGFSRDTLPVVELYESESRLISVAADRPPLEVYADVRALFNASPIFKRSL